MCKDFDAVCIEKVAWLDFPGNKETVWINQRSADFENFIGR